MDRILNHPGMVAAVSVALLWLSTHAGAYIERRWRPLREEERDALRTIRGATLTLLGLIIGFSFSMAVSRYDQRKTYEETEANAIGTEFLRTDLLPSVTAANVKILLRKYVDQRIAFYEERREDNLARINAQTSDVQRELWSAVQSVAAQQPTPVIALEAAGMNEVLNAEGYTQAAWWNRIPDGAWILMVAIAFCCCVLTGYSAHEARPALLVILPIVLSVAFFFIADIDSPRHGLILVVPHNLIRVAQSLGGT